MDQSSIRRNMSYLFLFKKLIYNLILDLHPICVNKWMHPICTKSIHKYYLNNFTVWSEYNDEYVPICDIDETFMQAAKYNNIIIAKWCLKNGANINVSNDFALCVASSRGYLKMVRFLFEKGANFDYDDNYALRYACKHGHLEIVQLFIERGIDLYNWGSYELMFSSEGGSLDVVKFLLEKNANIHALDDAALYYAVRNRHTEIAKLLLAKGAYAQEMRYDALEIAEKNGRLEVVAMMKNYLKDSKCRHQLKDCDYCHERVTPFEPSCS